MTIHSAAQVLRGPGTLRDRLKDESVLRDQYYIDGEWVGTPSLRVINPATGAEIAKVPVMGALEATRAVEAAERAFPAWAGLTAKHRSAVLRKWYELVVANREDLALRLLVPWRLSCDLVTRLR